MNKREKFLIIILAATAILMGGFKFIIGPQLKNIAQTRIELVGVVSEKQSAKENVLKAKTVKKENATFKEQINEATKPFFPELQNDKIQIYFNDLANKSGVSFSSFIMTNKVVSQITEQLFTDSTLKYPAKDSVNQMHEIENGTKTTAQNTAVPVQTANSAEKQVPKDLVEMMTVTIQFKGTYEQLLTFLDGIKNSGKTVRISALDTTMDEETGAIINHITAECFGVIQLSEKNTVAEETLPAPAGKRNPFAGS